jgi:transposase
VTGKSKKYTPEFREEACRLVIDGSRPVAEVSRKIGINESTLGYWVKAYRRKHSGDELPLDMPHRARLNELERRVKELEQENAFLKKAAAYFAREHR